MLPGMITGKCQMEKAAEQDLVFSGFFVKVLLPQQPVRFYSHLSHLTDDGSVHDPCDDVRDPCDGACACADDDAHGTSDHDGGIPFPRG